VNQLPPTDGARPVRVPIARVPGCEDLPLPVYATAGSAGLDLFAALLEPLTLDSGARAAIPTGVRIALPEGFEGQVRPRSGLALRQGLTLPNAPGTVDSDFRGELSVIVLNAGREPVTLRRGDRVAQLVVAPVARVEWEPVSALEATSRGDGGFGHTGIGAPDRKGP